ncbi:MAG: undecaprenyl-diphosphate phosphatase [Acidobacteria bacterium]|nr:undecaprenyl-diphosphate phosphatase [Acidobacteriota bacterium]
MSLLQAIVLAVVQGLTEFLPVSSTAHLILVPWLLGWQDPGLTYDVALHAGTLAAVLAYFARTWTGMLRALLGGARASRQASERGLLGLIVLATLPAALAGYFLESYAESVFRSPVLVAGALMAVAFFLWVADRRLGLIRSVESVGLADALVIGVAQAVAVVPGTSRAGITIAAGLFRNFRREEAARFSFMLATPIIAGATLLEGLKLWRVGFPTGVSTLHFAAGFVVSAVVGYAAIAFLLRYLQVQSLKIFVAYRLVLGGIILLVEFLRSSA